MKLFDNIFRENVSKAFSDYSADHLADRGWNLFKAARKGEHRIKAVIPLWARAASVALIVGTGAFIGYLIINQPSAEDILTVSDTESKKEIPSTVYSESPSSVSTVISEMSEPVRQKNEVRYAANLPAPDVSEHPAKAEQMHKEAAQVQIDTTVLPVVAEDKSQQSEDTINLAFEEALKEFLEGEHEETVTEEQEKRSGRTSLMAGVSGLLAQVRDAASTSPGGSFGFYLEQKITDRISLRPGLALAINSVGVDIRSGSYNEFAYSVPLYDGNSGTLDSYNGRLNMLAMELPLNIVFRVFEKERSGLFLSTGASTMIYISQQFSGDFVNEYTQNKLNTATGLIDSETRYSTITVENSYGAFSRTDYFGLANFSAGYSLPYGKTGTLLIEPFMQLPISDLTALNLRVRYGGISMKIRFGSPNNEK
jgi:hypothetical protein